MSFMDEFGEKPGVEWRCALAGDPLAEQCGSLDPHAGDRCGWHNIVSSEEKWLPQSGEGRNEMHTGSMTLGEFFDKEADGDAMLMQTSFGGDVVKAARIVWMLGYELSDTNVRQMLEYMRAMEIFVERNEIRKDLWSKAGWEDSLGHMRHKYLRLKDRFLGSQVLPYDESQEETLDDAYDLINYVTFFIRNVKADNREGEDI